MARKAGKRENKAESLKTDNSLDNKIALLAGLVFLLLALFQVIPDGYSHWHAVSVGADSIKDCKKQLDRLHVLVGRYKAKNKVYPENLEALGDGKKGVAGPGGLPVCPAATLNKVGQSYTITVINSGHYVIRCAGSNHTNIRYDKDQPYYDSLYGLNPTYPGEASPEDKPTTSVHFSKIIK